MFAQLFSWMFGTKNDREIRRMKKSVVAINALASEFEQLSDEELAGKTDVFRQRVEKGETLDQLLVEAFAVVRESSHRVLKMRHFDCQLVGGIALHNGSIAEMRTGEGKTLVATLPAYLNALTGKGVHVVTVNDYLARRDAEWMKPLYEFLGLTVGIVTSRQPLEDKKNAYKSDITYCTNNELGFDYLRDNMCFRLEDRVQRGRNFAIVDEVDSILIDEARTPLIISGPSSDSSALYTKINTLIPSLTEQAYDGGNKDGLMSKFSDDEARKETGHFFIDEKQRQVELTEMGHELVEEKLTQMGLIQPGQSLYSANNLTLLHHINAALKAHYLFRKDDHYIVQEGQIVIVDEHTGRLMPGRRWSDGIHQAIEAKEKLKIQQENQTHASTTFQNYFRLYEKLSGMTGTADTEAYEFRQIYGLNVVVIPTNKPLVRKDLDDLVYMTLDEKYQAVIADIKDKAEHKRPVLVGTASIESSELLHKLLKKEGIKHQVLNAKFHQKEAEIVAQAGKPEAVTIATNMAGRGTDIVLGGSWKAEIEQLNKPSQEQIDEIMTAWQRRHEQVIEAGGLHIISAERHESRRIDNQLRGRAGRQGDPGSTRFYLSLEDSLMRIFASDRMRNMMQSIGMEKGEAIEHRWVSRSIENAQKKVEGRNFDIRKSLLEYDDVANEQRQAIYMQRDDILTTDSVLGDFTELREEVVGELVGLYLPFGVSREKWDVSGLERTIENDFRLGIKIPEDLINAKESVLDGILSFILEKLTAAYKEKETVFESADRMRQLEKEVMLSVLDRLWKDHLSNMEHLRRGIHLRGYAQKNPKQEYKREAFELFQTMLGSAKHEIVKTLSSIEIKQVEEVEAFEQAQLDSSSPDLLDTSHPPVNESQNSTSALEVGAEKDQKPMRAQPKVGRNQACPCGSGKKYKHCHGKMSA